MSDGWGTVRTKSGEVAIGPETIRIGRRPGAYLRARLSSLRRGGRRERIRAAFGVVVLLSVPPLVAGTLAFTVVPFWLRHLRESRIPVGAIEDVTLDVEARELTLVHDADGPLAVLDGDGRQWFGDGDLLAAFEGGRRETTLILQDAAEAREARSLLRSTGIARPVDVRRGDE